MSSADQAVQVHQLRIWIRKISPQIWRRLLVRSEEGVGSTFTVLLPLSSRGDTHPAVSAAVGVR